MAELNDAFSLKGRSDRQWKNYGLTPSFDGENVRSVSNDESWENDMDVATIEELRRRWIVEEPTFDVTFRCVVSPCSSRATPYDVPMRVSGQRGDWADLAPAKTDVLVPAGFDEYRVELSLTHRNETFVFLNGRFKNDDKLVALGRNVYGKIFFASRGCVLFVHWVGTRAPGFVTASVNFSDECPV